MCELAAAVLSKGKWLEMRINYACNTFECTLIHSLLFTMTLSAHVSCRLIPSLIDVYEYHRVNPRELMSHQ